MLSSRFHSLPSQCWFAAAVGSIMLLTCRVGAEPSTLVDDFNDGVQNALGGYRGTFAAEPSAASAMRVADVFRGSGGRSVRIVANRAEQGFCGYWIHFFDMRSVERRYFDASRFSYLSFWVRGAEGGEDFLIKLADEQWVTKQDSVTFSPAAQLLPDGITTEWQEIVLALRGHSPLDWRQLGGVTFEFVRSGKQVVFIDDLTFKTRLEDMPVATRGFVAAAVPAANSMPRKLWVWSTAKLLRDAATRRELFELCQSQRIDELWMQLLYDVQRKDAETATTTCRLRFADDFRLLLSESHERGLRVHGLDGYPEFAVRENHDIPLALVDAVIAFNRGSPAQESFDGIHFDNEPYLLIGWQHPAQREEILHDFLTLNAECQRRIRMRSHMQFGVDIPFWWQERDDSTGRIVGEVDFAGKRQAASFHCLEMLDNVGVMNYRDVADGADGMIAHGRELLEYADRYGRAIVYMGVETFREQPTPVWMATGVPREQFQEVLTSTGKHLARLSRLNGFRLRTLDDGQHISMGIELPWTRTPDTEKLATKTMVEIASHFGVRIALDDSDAVLEQIAKAIATDGEWSNLRSRPIIDGAKSTCYSGFLLDSKMLKKLTFADNSVGEFQTQVRAAEQYFGRYQCYGGTAIHCYESFREKLHEMPVTSVPGD